MNATDLSNFLRTFVTNADLTPGVPTQLSKEVALLWRELLKDVPAETANHAALNLVARQPGDSLPRMVLDGVLQARFAGDLCQECRLWWHSQPAPP